MRQFLKNITTQENGIRSNHGSGHIILGCKNNADREKYIQNCLLKNSVTIAFENGFFIENVLVLKHVWQDLIFPLDIRTLGSQIWWNKDPNTNNIIIVGVIYKNNDVLNLKENQFSIQRTLNNNHIEISGDVKAGILNIIVDGGKDQGELNIDVFNKLSSSKVKLNVKGDIQIECENKISIYPEKGFSVRNSKDNLSKILDSFVDEIIQLIILTPAGTGKVSDTSVKKLNTIKERFKKIINES